MTSNVSCPSGRIILDADTTPLRNAYQVENNVHNPGTVWTISLGAKVVDAHTRWKRLSSTLEAGQMDEGQIAALLSGSEDGFLSLLRNRQDILAQMYAHESFRPYVYQFFGDISAYLREERPDHKFFKLLDPRARKIRWQHGDYHEIAKSLLMASQAFTPDDWVELFLLNHQALDEKKLILSDYLEHIKPQLVADLTRVLTTKSRGVGRGEIETRVVEALDRVAFEVKDPIMLVRAAAGNNESEVLEVGGQWVPTAELISVSANAVPLYRWDLINRIVSVLSVGKGEGPQVDKFPADVFGQLYSLIFHEALHAVSSRKFCVEPFPSEEEEWPSGSEQLLAEVSAISDQQERVRALVDKHWEYRGVKLKSHRSGVKIFGQFGWLNEAIIEQLNQDNQSVRQPLSDGESRVYGEERILYRLLRERVPEHYFVNALLDREDDPNNTHFQALMQAIEQAFGKMFLHELDRVVHHPKLGIRHAISFVQEGLSVAKIEAELRAATFELIREREERD